MTVTILTKNAELCVTKFKALCKTQGFKYAQIDSTENRKYKHLTELHIKAPKAVADGFWFFVNGFIDGKD